MVDAFLLWYTPFPSPKDVSISAHYGRLFKEAPLQPTTKQQPTLHLSSETKVESMTSVQKMQASTFGLHNKVKKIQAAGVVVAGTRHSINKTGTSFMMSTESSIRVKAMDSLLCTTQEWEIGGLWANNQKAAAVQQCIQKMWQEYKCSFKFQWHSWVLLSQEYQLRSKRTNQSVQRLSYVRLICAALSWTSPRA